MTNDRMVGATCVHPFPVYPRLADTLAAAHVASPDVRDATVAHVLGTCAGYAYADTDTVATIVTRLGLPGHACVRIAQTVDAMFIFSTAYVFQSACGRIAILCYRGTEPGRLGNWLGDADVGQESSCLSLSDGAEKVRVHAGFHRNVRATQWAILQELTAAIEGRSLANHDAAVEHPLEALYITGHSLGGAMAALFALTVCGNSAHRSIADRLRAVYTFGQPMAVSGPPTPTTERIGTKMFRHIVPRDPVPALPPAPWGPVRALRSGVPSRDRRVAPIGGPRRADGPPEGHSTLAPGLLRDREASPAVPAHDRAPRARLLHRCPSTCRPRDGIRGPWRHCGDRVLTPCLHRGMLLTEGDLADRGTEGISPSRAAAVSVCG